MSSTFISVFVFTLSTGSDCHSTASPKYTFAILPDTVHPLLLAQNSESNSAVPSDPSLPGAIMHSESGTENVIFIVLPTTEPSSHRRKLTLYLAKLLNTVLLHVDELQVSRGDSIFSNKFVVLLLHVRKGRNG